MFLSLVRDDERCLEIEHLLTDEYDIINYTRKVKNIIHHSQFIEVYKFIRSSDVWRVYDYARYVLKAPWIGPLKDEAEQIIASKADYAYTYARYILKGPWTGKFKDLAEESIASNPQCGYEYALHVLKCPWTCEFKDEAEKNIASSIVYAHWYACNVLKGRWTGKWKDLAEESIRRYDDDWNKYQLL